MKLLCWMHRKFRQNSHEALKALVMGQSSVDDQQYFPRASHGSATSGGRGFKQSQASQQLRNTFTGVVASDEISDELFHGFLAIGTLGVDHHHHHLETPTFAISVDNIIADKEADATTENDLRLINDELEKLLLLDAASRTSHVSTGRSNHGSVITLSGKPDDSASRAVCPLQGYLFASATAGIRNKDNNAGGGRTSLGELFQRSKMPDSGDDTKKDAAAADCKSTTTAMKKKKMLHASSRSSTSAAGGDSSAPSETKLHKILHMFHRKVHPETSEGIVKAAGNNNKAPQKNEQRKKTAHDGSCHNEEGQTAPDEDMTLCPHRHLFLKQQIRRYRSQSNPPQFTFGSVDCNGNREQWIKTDADYLVLEL